MGISRSSFYHKTNKEKVTSDLEWKKLIVEINGDFPGYGYRRIERELRSKGHLINHKKVLRLMKKFGIESCHVRKKNQFQVYQKLNDGRPFENLLRDFEVTATGQAWATDITFIRLESGFVYLAAIIDIYSRVVVGWAISKKMDYVLCINALDSALSRREIKEGCIHHSDQGAQYRSEEYVKYLKESGFRISMSDKGSPTQNAFIESFFKTLKYEEIYFKEYKTLHDVMKKLPKFIEEVYNAKRLHSSLGYKSPLAYEKELTEKAS